ncbi:MAG TPA: ABC transporter ATP-binding protein [Bacteriovoracaceae bacterium]|nr:ABC transporter ATP-binding protein [Bacteriovoracaceae bacterium]
MEKIISIKNLSYEIPYSGTILENINLEMGPNEFLGILGHNGAGKTTLLDIILGFKVATQGEVKVLGESSNDIDRKNKNQIIFLSQDVALRGNLSVGDFLKFVSDLYPNYSKEDAKRLMPIFKLKSDTLISSLSTGQQKKVQIVAGLATRPKLLIIDEVTAVLDPEARIVLFTELQKLKTDYGTSIVIATNIAEDLTGIVDRVMFVKDKRANMYGPGEIMNLFQSGRVA